MHGKLLLWNALINPLLPLICQEYFRVHFLRYEYYFIKNIAQVTQYALQL